MIWKNLGVPKNRGTPKWMAYNGKPYWNGWFGGKTHYFRKHLSQNPSDPKGQASPLPPKIYWAEASRGVCIQPHHKCPGDVVGCSGDVAIRNELSNVKKGRFYAPRCLFEKLGGMKTRCCYSKCCSYIDSPAFLTRNIIAMFVYQNCTSSVFRWSLENWVGVFRGASCIASIWDWSQE